MTTTLEAKINKVLEQQELLMKHLGLEKDPEAMVRLIDLAKGDIVRSNSLARKAVRLKIELHKEGNYNTVKYKDVAALENTKRSGKE